VKKLLLAGATLFIAACSQAPTAPGSKLAPRQKASLDEQLACRSGYIVAYDEEGNAYCKLDDSGLMGGGVVGDTTTAGPPGLHH
jgi:hypothetical protein